MEARMRSLFHPRLVPLSAVLLCTALLWLITPRHAAAQEPSQAPAIDRLRDRGDGLPLSMFGTYIRRGDLIVYPFFEYYRDHDYEYEAGELGFSGTTEHRAQYRASEGLLLLAYGISENVAFEFEAAGISATLHKSPLDDSAMPPQLSESGLGDVESQLRWRWRKESDSRPELFSYFETVFPLQRDQKLIGTSGWEFKFGTGLIRGLSWGTITVRGSVAAVDGGVEIGEYAFEYLRRLSPRWRIFAAVEGSEDEVEVIGEAQLFLTPRVCLKLNNAFGVTSKATDWAPEVGIAFVF
jgi:hypothetical protein